MAKAIFFFLLLMLAINKPVLPAEETATREIKKVVGVVVSVDWVASKITVRYYDNARASNDELTLGVPDDASLYRGTEKILLSDIEENDAVEIEYYGSGFNGLKVINIMDNNLGNS